MGIASGLDSQLGFSPESTVGTRVVPATFLEYIDEGIQYKRDRIVSKGRKTGRRTQGRWKPGIAWAEGPVQVELAPQSIGKLFKWMFGAVSTSGANPYTHVFTPGTLDDEALTIQFSKPTEDGTSTVWEYTGCQCMDWSIGCKVNKYAILNVNVYAMNEDTSQSLASASYPATWSPFTFVSGSLSIASSAYEIDDIMITGNNGLKTGRHRIRATTPHLPVQSREASYRQYGGTINSDFFSTTAYNRFVNGTEAALSLVFNDGASAQLTIAGNVRFDGDTPNVKGDEMIPLTLPFVFTSLTSDAATITATLINADSTP